MLHIDENIKLIKNTLNDTTETEKLLRSLENDDGTSSHALLAAFSGKAKFAVAFDEWIRNQARPFLGFKPLDDSSSFPASRPNIPAANDPAPGNQKSVPTVKVKKPKKRVTPTTIAAALPSSLSNISSSVSFSKSSASSDVSLTEQWPVLGATTGAKRSTGVWPGPADSKTKLSAASFVEKKPDVALFPASAATLPSAVNGTRGSTSAPPPTLPLPQPAPPLCRHISTSVKTQLDHYGVTVRVLEATGSMTRSGATDVIASDGTAAGVVGDRTTTFAVATIAAANLARVHACLVTEQFLPIVPTFILLCRLLTARQTYTSLGKELLVDVENDSKFPSCLLCDSHLVMFLSAAAKSLQNCFASLGTEVCAAFMDLLEGIDPVLTNSVRVCMSPLSPLARGNSIADDDPATGLGEQSLGTVTRQANESAPVEDADMETFIRPFHDELDSRHEYRTQVESTIYNERERCYDDFSNLFRQFEEANRSDLDGSRTEEFWPKLSSMRDRLLHISDCNFIWFAEIFKEMLLFHGTNLPKGRSGVTSSDGVPQQQKQYRNLEERLGPGGRAQGASGNNRRNVMGGSGTSSGHAGSQKITSFFSSLRDPSSCFPGYQQFFFRYLLVMDSARLNCHLSAVLIHEILTLTNVNDSGPYSDLVSCIMRAGWVPGDGLVGCMPSPPEHRSQSNQPSGRYISFTSRILKLKILGRFLGLLHFYPSWTLSIGAAVPMESPLMTLLTSAASVRSKVNPSMSIPLAQMVSCSWREGTLMLTSVWIISYLRMLAWDRTSILNSSPRISLSEVREHSTVPAEHIAVVSTLHAITRSQDFSIKTSQRISRNRMYILSECQSFFSDFPLVKQLVGLNKKYASLALSTKESSSTGIDQETVFPTAPARQWSGPSGGSALLRQSIDDGNAALSMSFLKHLVPHLYSTSLYMQQRKAWAVAALRRKIEGGNGVQSDLLVTRRQAPVHISSNTTTSSAFRSSGPAKSSGSVPPSPTPSTPRSMSFDVLSPRSPARSAAISLSNSTTGSGALTAANLSSLLNAMSPPPPPAPFGAPSLVQGTPSGVLLEDSASPMDPPTETAEIHLRMETAFWHRYPQLHQISTGFLDHLNNALRQRLKDRVGDLVLKGWACVEVVKAECKTKSMEEFRAVLDRDTTRLIQSYTTDTDAFVEEFFDEHVATTLQALFSVYPLAAGVVSTAMGLTRKHKPVARKNHMDYFSSYAKKKISEVCTSSVHQREKMEAAVQRADGQVATAAAVSRGENIPGIGETDLLLAVCGGIDKLLRNLSIDINNMCSVDSFKSMGGSVRVVSGRRDGRLAGGDSAIMFNEESCGIEIAMPIESMVGEDRCRRLFVLHCFCGHICSSVGQLLVTVGKMSLAASASANVLFSHKTVRQWARNCINFLLCVCKWCQVVRDECGDIECRGRIRIEVMKMLTIIGNPIFFFDTLLSREPEVADSGASCQDHDYNIHVPSDILVEACRMGLITVNGFCDVISPVLKPSLYSTFSGYRHDMILLCIGRLLCMKSAELDLDLDIDIYAGTWLTDPAVKRSVKANVSAELTKVIDQVASAVS